MGCRIIEGYERDEYDKGAEKLAVLYCSTTGWAFGPVFNGREHAQRFLDWLSAQTDRDPRNLADHELSDYFDDFKKEVSSG